jgi:hypothetical protein
MITTYREEFRTKGQELRIGWASWDDNKFVSRSIKYIYRDAIGKISRGCPELPFDVLVEMVLLAKRQGMLAENDVNRIREAFE